MSSVSVETRAIALACRLLREKIEALDKQLQDAIRETLVIMEEAEERRGSER